MRGDKISKYITSTKHNQKDEPLYVGILAGTIGYREKVKGAKILNQFGKTTVLENQCNTIRHFDTNSKVSITVGFQADKIIRTRPAETSIIENRLYEEENTAEEIRLLLNSINPYRLLLVDNAVIFEHHDLIEICQTSSIITYISDNDEDVGVYSEDDKVINFSFGLKNKWTGLVYLEGRTLDIFKKIITRETTKLMLHELLNILIDRKGELNVIDGSKSKIVRF